jgi:predicted membrane protein
MYGIIGFFLISVFITVFPVLAVLLIVILAVSGILILYRYIKAGIKKAVKPDPEYDEYGSRKIKSSVIDMKESDRLKDRTKQNGDS